MDQTALVTDEIEIGRKAAEALDQSGLKVRSLFWLYMPGPEEWWLMIGTSLVDKQGPRAAYKAIADVLEKSGLKQSLPLDRVSALSLRDPRIKLLRTKLKTGAAGQNGGIWLRGSVIDGNYLGDAYVYRMR